MPAPLTRERVFELLTYEPETGLFRWAVPRKKIRVGQIAGTNQRGYRMIKVDGSGYFAHRLAWLCTYGHMPSGPIDHINLDRGDNRIANLRLATISQNAANSEGRKDNKSGFKGVSWNQRSRKWVAQIRFQGGSNFLGSFNSAEEAKIAYDAAAVRLFGEFARVGQHSAIGSKAA